MGLGAVGGGGRLEGGAGGVAPSFHYKQNHQVG